MLCMCVCAVGDILNSSLSVVLSKSVLQQLQQAPPLTLGIADDTIVEATEVLLLSYSSQDQRVELNRNMSRVYIVDNDRKWEELWEELWEGSSSCLTLCRFERVIH